jgi:DNA-binding transcriptional ArsR family regulator
MPRRIDGGIAVLADPTRRRLIAAIALRPAVRPSKLALQLGLSRSAVSRQLRRLHEAGLLVVQDSYVDGRWLYYSVNPLRQGQILAWLAGTEVGLETRRDRPADAASGSPGDDSSASDDSPVVAAKHNNRSVG